MVYNNKPYLNINFNVQFKQPFRKGVFMEHIIGITNARNNIKEIVDTISDKNDTYIITRGCVPEAVIISYKRYIEQKNLLKIVEELKYEKSIKNSQLQFKKWLDQKGFDTSRISEEEIGDMIKNLHINNNS